MGLKNTDIGLGNNKTKAKYNARPESRRKLREKLKKIQLFLVSHFKRPPKSVGLILMVCQSTVLL